MILQILSDLRPVDQHRDIVRLQVFGRSDARQHQQLRRLDGAGRKNDATARLDVSRPIAGTTDNADGLSSLEQHARHLRVGEHGEIVALLSWPEIRLRRRLPPAILGGELEIPGAFLTATVEVVGARHAVGLRGADHGFDQFVLAADAADRQGPMRAVQLVIAEFGVAFDLEKIRQDLGPVPAGITLLAPAVVIFLLAADHDQAVDRARSAEHLAARPIDLAAGHVRLRLGLEFPIDLGIPHRLAVADRQMDPETFVAWSRFEHCNGGLAVGAQTVGKHAAR